MGLRYPVEDKDTALGRIRLCVVEDASTANLTSAVRECVEPASTIRTDGWPGYNDLQAEGYTHKVVRGESVMGDNLLPLAHRVASLLRRWMLGTHQGAVRPSHLPYYLDEFTFRFNRKNVSLTRQILLPLDSTIRRGSSRDGGGNQGRSRKKRRLETQDVVCTGVKCIAT